SLTLALSACAGWWGTGIVALVPHRPRARRHPDVRRARPRRFGALAFLARERLAAARLSGKRLGAIAFGERPALWFRRQPRQRRGAFVVAAALALLDQAALADPALDAVAYDLRPRLLAALGFPLVTGVDRLVREGFCDRRLEIGAGFLDQPFAELVA